VRESPNTKKLKSSAGMPPAPPAHAAGQSGGAPPVPPASPPGLIDQDVDPSELRNRRIYQQGNIRGLGYVRGDGKANSAHLPNHGRRFLDFFLCPGRGNDLSSRLSQDQRNGFADAPPRSRDNSRLPF